jgi:phosphoserine phosphatase
MTDEILSKIRKKIDVALDNGAHPIAAFDADGTLWDMDMGEHFFQYQIEKKLIPDFPKDPWKYYRDFHDKDAAQAFLWLAQINNGFSLEQVREWAAESVQALPHLPIFPWMESIIDHLHRRNVDVYVVTASVKWAVEPAAKKLGISYDKVIGITTKVKDGIVTDEQDGPITWREGKVTGLLEKTGRKAPFFCAGNTLGDLALLDCSTQLRLANTVVPASHGNFETEQKLLEIAKNRGWLFHTGK